MRSVSPEVDQQKLEKFDHSRQKISTLLVNDKHEVSLEDCSKPVREVIKVSYGVSYNESLQKGGKANCSMGGQSVYDNPKRKTMRLDELKKRQDTERKTKLQTYIDGKV